MSNSPINELFRMQPIGDPRDAMIQELWKRLDDYRAEEKEKLRRDVDQAHAKIRFWQRVFWKVFVPLLLTVVAALAKELAGK